MVKQHYSKKRPTLLRPIQSVEYMYCSSGKPIIPISKVLNANVWLARPAYESSKALNQIA